MDKHRRMIVASPPTVLSTRPASTTPGPVARHCLESHDVLQERTRRFHRALFGSTLPNYLRDAVSANLGILKSPTVLRQEDGMMWCWEGSSYGNGCCAGSCTHVWNYAQALP